MNLYKFDPDTGKYLGTKEAKLDEWQTKIKGSPSYFGEANSTFVSPEFLDGFTPYLQNDVWVNVKNPTAEELAEQALAQAKAERSEAVASITVEVDGMVFDGDENAQRRMTVAMSTARSKADRINAERKAEWQKAVAENPDADLLEPAYDNYLDYTTPWVLADNTIVTATISQLSQACELAGTEQSALWVKPYAG